VILIVIYLYYTVSQKTGHAYYRVAQKSKPPPIFQKIVLKIANEIRFFVKLNTYESSTIIQSVGNKYSVRDLLL